MIDTEFIYEQQLTYLKKWVDSLNRKRLLEVRSIIDEQIGMVEFKEKLKEDGITL